MRKTLLSVLLTVMSVSGICLAQTDQAGDYRRLQTFNPKSTGQGVPAGQLTGICKIPHYCTRSPKRGCKPGAWRYKRRNSTL